MSDRHEDSDARLERLRRATEGAGPRADFAARVAARIEHESAPIGWLSDLLRPARRLVPIAAIAAAVGLVWAAQSERAGRVAASAESATELDTQW